MRCASVSRPDVNDLGLNRNGAASTDAPRRAHMPPGTERILNFRTLQTSHRALVRLLRPGLRVLDVGCGTGSITRGIAEAVSPEGHAVGIDVSSDLLEQAREACAESRNLDLVQADIFQFVDSAGFDVVTAARVLQWLADPMQASRAMAALTRPGGHVVILDYDHASAEWDPALPPAAARFYRTFLAWRREAGMENNIASRLPALLAGAGLIETWTSDERETTVRNDSDFPQRTDIWVQVAASRGHQMVADHALTEAERPDGEQAFRRWAMHEATRQTLHLTAACGRRPSL